LFAIFGLDGKKKKKKKELLCYMLFAVRCDAERGVRWRQRACRSCEARVHADRVEACSAAWADHAVTRGRRGHEQGVSRTVSACGEVSRKPSERS
jgi:hypothetical protein